VSDQAVLSVRTSLDQIETLLRSDALQEFAVSNDRIDNFVMARTRWRAAWPEFAQEFEPREFLSQALQKPSYNLAPIHSAGPWRLQQYGNTDWAGESLH
jgi:hypothetical protein